MSVFDYFVGTQQSKYASIAMVVTLIVMCIAILVTNTDIPVGNRIGVVLFFILLSIFPIAISLFELTCIVTGGRNTKTNLCYYWAWFVTILIAIYCFILIIVTISSMFTYKKAMLNLQLSNNVKVSNSEANDIAQNMLSENFANYKSEQKKKEAKDIHAGTSKKPKAQKPTYRSSSPSPSQRSASTKPS